MMKFHKPGRLRMLGGAAAIAMLGGLSLAFGSAGAAAQPAPPAPPAAGQYGGHGSNERVIVRTYRNDGDGDHRGGNARGERHGSADGERREERHVTVITTDRNGGDSDGRHVRVIERNGDRGDHITRVITPDDCANARGRSEVNEGDDRNRTRIIVCTRGGTNERSAAQQADALQRARARVADDNQVPAEQRERVLAAIDREIARLRAGQ